MEVFELIQEDIRKGENVFLPENFSLELSVSRVLFDSVSKTEIFQDLLGDPQKIDISIYQSKFFSLETQKDLTNVLSRARTSFDQFTDSQYSFKHP